MHDERIPTPGPDDGSVGPLHWCTHCGDRVPHLDEREQCPRCSEIEAYTDEAQLDVAASILEATVLSALEWLHPDDVMSIVATAIEVDGNRGLLTRDEARDRLMAFAELRHQAGIDKGLRRLLGER